jgi:hypothetical protein
MVPAAGEKDTTVTIIDLPEPVQDEHVPRLSRTPWPARSSVRRAWDARPVLRVDLLVSGEPCWRSNDLRFLDEGEALAFARGLRSRWTVVEAFRVVPESTPGQQVYEPGSEYPRSDVSGGAAGSRVRAG